MRKNISKIVYGLAVVSATACLWSCAAETPFDDNATGIVKLRTVINHITTRSEESGEQSLEDNLVVYISKVGEGLVYKKQGKIDDQIVLKAGNYVAEAWTGDSVSASFDKKFYRGYQPITVTKGGICNEVINCRIANVVVSVNTNTIDPKLMNDDYDITVKHSRGELHFTKDNAVDEKAYFMMPKDVHNLEYTITGTKAVGGASFSESGVIENVESAHNYILNFTYGDNNYDPNAGGAFITIKVKDENLFDDNRVIFTRPVFSGVGFDIQKQLNFVDDESIPVLVSIQICGDGLKNITLTPPENCIWKSLLGIEDSDLDNSETINFSSPEAAEIIQKFKDNGIELIAPVKNEETKIWTAYLNISKSVFSQISHYEGTEKAKEHVFIITAKDSKDLEGNVELHFARDEDAINTEDPIVVYDSDFLSAKLNSVTLSYSLSDEIDGVPGVEYSKSNEDNWTFVTVANNQTRATTKPTITISGLEQGTSYKYRARCGEFIGEEKTFITESAFVIPNASMEDWSNWSSNSKVVIPGANGERTFWDSGNHGSSTMNVTLTQSSEDLKHSGSKAARLRSQFVGIGSIGKFAAGNLFVGEYVKTDGTDGVLSFGKPYNGSHPTALSIWANYRPGKVDKKGKNDSYLKEGETDQAQIYVALSTAPIEIKTKNAEKLFDPNAPEILAYGQVTWTDNFGPDNALQNVTIPLEYYDRAKNTEAKYLIIVCSASKFGDYFCGGEGSLMYLDDFELIYE